MSAQRRKPAAVIAADEGVGEDVRLEAAMLARGDRRSAAEAFRSIAIDEGVGEDRAPGSGPGASRDQLTTPGPLDAALGQHVAAVPGDADLAVVARDDLGDLEPGQFLGGRFE